MFSNPFFKGPKGGTPKNVFEFLDAIASQGIHDIQVCMSIHTTQSVSHHLGQGSGLSAIQRCQEM